MSVILNSTTAWDNQDLNGTADPGVQILSFVMPRDTLFWIKLSIGLTFNLDTAGAVLTATVFVESKINQQLIRETLDTTAFTGGKEVVHWTLGKPDFLAEGGTVLIFLYSDNVNDVNVSGAAFIVDHYEHEYDGNNLGKVADVTLANVAHGGAVATLALKSIDVQNPDGNAVTYKSTGNNGQGMRIEGNGSGTGIHLRSINGIGMKIESVGATGVFISGNDKGVRIFGNTSDAVNLNSNEGGDLVAAEIDDIPKFASTGVTVGGTMTYRQLLKIASAWFAGNWRDKDGSPGVHELLDADDGSVILTMTYSETTPQKQITVNVT